MINKKLFNGLKNYYINDDNIESIAQAFPLVLGNLLRMMNVQVPPRSTVNLLFDRDKFLEFINNFGYAILNEDFDLFDNLIIEFISTYHYVILPYKYIIDLDEEQKIIFINLCNSFKGKKWNDILDIFVDGLYDLLSLSTVNGAEITLG
jgi:hypothetical protein